MSQAARQEVQALYRSYQRLVQEWPADKVRPSKDYKQFLTTRVEETFQQAEPNLVEEKKQLDALERLLANEYKQKYHLSEKILTPQGNPNYYTSLLSTLGTTTDGKKTGLARFFGN